MSGAAGRLYTHLCWFGTAAGSDLFDMHVAASILAIAAHEGTDLSAGSGLCEREVRTLFVLLFPEGINALGRFSLSAIEPDEEESNLRDILFMHSAQASIFERLLAHMIARRSLRPNHLWQDLGLGSRAELSLLMQRHFPRLAQRNSNDMKWKKFFYRMMCSSAGYSLCVAPVCSECDDVDQCFGEEKGEALLARTGRYT